MYIYKLTHTIVSGKVSKSMYRYNVSKETPKTYEILKGKRRKKKDKFDKVYTDFNNSLSHTSYAIWSLAENIETNRNKLTAKATASYLRFIEYAKECEKTHNKHVIELVPVSERFECSSCGDVVKKDKGSLERALCEWCLKEDDNE